MLNQAVFLQLANLEPQGYQSAPIEPQRSRYVRTSSNTAELQNPYPSLGSFLEINPIPPSQNFVPDVPSRRPIPNIILLSSDFCSFYADESSLLLYSNNNFRGLLPLLSQEREQQHIFLQDVPSSELEFILRAIYNIPTRTHTVEGNISDFQILSKCINWLPIFGIQPKSIIVPYTHLFDKILSFAPLDPLEVYALVAHYDMHDLAIAVSPHTLPVESSNITEDLAQRMGASYLLRLLRLHIGREEILKNLLGTEPDLHDETAECGFEDQKSLGRMWNMGVASLTWFVRADTATSLIHEIIMAHTGDIVCGECIKARDARLNTVLTEWSMAVRSI
ncbi:hypothetical protein Moror_15909 [Moniliophthora roreri MCA 2997]|uniref:BTB domain-containing protein n=1 Tax=Moniliophthora roreri (strain MCA 2997) TaxID=1381753 RepID=V2XIS5_MONRO|nr:hypothetical protein Moror_15909 [Moniliophthora roreri MCA 2997]